VIDLEKFKATGIAETGAEVGTLAGVTRIYERIIDQKRLILALKGGAGSGKTHAVMQFIIFCLENFKGLKIGVIRTTLPALERTVITDFFYLMQAYGLYDIKNHNRSKHVYSYNGNSVEFFALGEELSPEEKEKRIKSANYNMIWAEEATDFSRDEILQFSLRLRWAVPDPIKLGDGTEFKWFNRMILSFNPIDENHWIAQPEFSSWTNSELEPMVEWDHSTYKDNPHLPQNYIDTIEAMIDQSPNKYRVYALGEWGRLEDVIYTNWNTCLDFPNSVRAWAYGLDYGYEKPTALVKVGLGHDGNIYVDELLYEKGLTNQALIEKLTHTERADIYADNDPNRIEEIGLAGWNIYPCQKGRDSIRYGIDLCKRQDLIFTQRSANAIAEIKGYSRKRDRNGELIDEPAKVNDHAMDAMLYGVEGLVKRYGHATQKPGPQKVLIKRFA